MSAELEKRVPATMLGESAPSAPLVSEAEMKDILSGFTPDDAEGRSSFSTGPQSRNMGVVLDIGLVATARLGRVEMPISQILGLGPGSIIEMAQLVDEPIDLLVNDRLVARGDVVVVDEKFGIRITEIISRTERIENLR
jgi:flagellar motor switch protein FliN/FliY